MKKSIFTFALALVLTSGIATASEAHPSLSNSSEYPVEKLAALNLNSLCKAIIAGNYDMVTQLIQMGEDINQKSLGKTPAMYAARYNKADILSLLIEKGADLSVKSDQEKQTAEEFAVNSNAKETIEVLKKAGRK
ncbi:MULTISPECIES: ankyrin repeat domain-containing protein [Zunongwangia]|uniref:Ankyrin n=2 Tax=Zunongwangia profunda TaxID=398743 RepID=D5BDK0_ZUNPS|nr:ankyrin repeat domain-containing protein [Zunongwangia profunda]MAG86219.1 ankyrin repeat domain-containing protein [Flavobacteriaceae bacterium]MAS72588.1 ankyrin repeat domain-containing protein [Zunongwangia sp.]ADF54906.1 Ankyrin [Zunongwangia profunda SM-A87]MCC4226597.1 ankyrin repeat domain-containing protein [Zunongwangia profunda]HAJ82645.1 ankyrin repeat domain-containing protein [Zunongwangia profunda]|tara:strand:+ start:2795 stop:3199 length:405 start_codon:yes stop_codon:yes gene_type:complete